MQVVLLQVPENIAEEPMTVEKVNIGLINCLDSRVWVMASFKIPAEGLKKRELLQMWGINSNVG